MQSIEKKLTKYIYLLLFIVLVSLSVGQAASALEITYPTFPGIADPPRSGDLPGYIKYVFVFSTAIAGIIGVIAIAVAGLKILVSAGNPAAISDAKDRLFSAALGIVLLLFSFVILNTINPSLTQPEFTVGGPGRPVIVVPGRPAFDNANPLGIETAYAQSPIDGYTIIAEAPSDVDDLDIYPDDASFFYPCGSIPQAVFFYGYTEEFQDDYDDEADLQEITCNTLLPLGGLQSFRWSYVKAGIYFFLEPECEGIGTNVITSTQTLSEAFQNKVKSARIINDLDSEKYGFILYNDLDFEGGCTIPFQNQDNSKSIEDPTNMGICVEVASCQVSTPSSTSTFTPTPTTPTPTTPTPTTPTPST